MKLLLPLVCLVGLQSALGSVAYFCDQDKLTALEQQLTLQKKELTVLTKQLQLQNAQLQVQNEQLQLQDEKIEALEKTETQRHEVEENQIAFSVASDDNFGPVTEDTNIPFPVVYTNVGDAWHPVISAFQATTAGFYLFTTSFRGATNGTTWASIVHTTTSRSQKIASLYSSTNFWIGDANTAILQVETGDYVSAQLLADSGVIDSGPNNIYSTFSGHLLFP